MVNFANVFFGLGGLATPFIAADLLSGNPMRLEYLVAGLAFIVLLWALVTALPARSDQSGFDLAEVVDIQQKPLLLLLCLVALFYVGCKVGFWNWLPKYLMSRGDNARTALNTLGFGFDCGITAGRLIAMQVLRRVSAPIVCIAASAAMAVATYATIHLRNPALVMIAVFCSGVAMGPVYPSAIGITGESFRRMTGTCIGLVITFGWFGGCREFVDDRQHSRARSETLGACVAGDSTLVGGHGFVEYGHSAHGCEKPSSYCIDHLVRVPAFGKEASMRPVILSRFWRRTSVRSVELDRALMASPQRS
jgi:hypothetical protein